MKVFYYFLFVVWYLFSLMPFWLLYLISDLVYYPLYYVIRYRRKIVRKNITESFPEKSLDEIVKIEKDFYQFFCDYVVETVKLFSMSEKQMRKRMSFEGLDEVIHYLETRNCVLYLGHYCNWEWVSSLPVYFRATDCTQGQIYHALENKAFDSLFLRLRGRFGSVNIEMNNALRSLMQLKRKKERFVVGFIADQAPNWNNIHFWTRFLNHESAFFIGAERIAKNVDAVVYYIDMKRLKRGYYHGEFVKISDTPKEMPDYEVTTEYARLLEQSIRRDPQYWLWSHNRWKRTHEEFIKRKSPEKI